MTDAHCTSALHQPRAVWLHRTHTPARVDRPQLAIHSACTRCARYEVEEGAPIPKKANRPATIARARIQRGLGKSIAFVSCLLSTQYWSDQT